MTLVLDASVALAWVFADEKSDAAENVLGTIYDRGAHAPAMLAIETANALNVGLRRGRLSVDDWHEAASVIRQLPVAFDECGRDRALGDVMPLARRHGLFVYDAIYLELALRLSLPLATFDRQLQEAADASGCRVFEAVR